MGEAKAQIKHSDILACPPVVARSGTKEGECWNVFIVESAPFCPLLTYVNRQKILINPTRIHGPRVFEPLDFAVGFVNLLLITNGEDHPIRPVLMGPFLFCRQACY